MQERITHAAGALTSLCNLLNCPDAESVRYAVRALANLARGAGRISLSSVPGILLKLQVCAQSFCVMCHVLATDVQVLLESPDEECRRHAGRALKTLTMPSSGGYTPPGYHTHINRCVCCPARFLFFSFFMEMPCVLGPAAKVSATMTEPYFHGALRLPSALPQSHSTFFTTGIFRADICGKIFRRC